MSLKKGMLNVWVLCVWSSTLASCRNCVTVNAPECQVIDLFSWKPHFPSHSNSIANTPVVNGRQCRMSLQEMQRANLLRQNFRKGQHISRPSQFRVLDRFRHDPFCLHRSLGCKCCRGGVIAQISWHSPEVHPSHFPLPAPSLCAFATWCCHLPLTSPS